MNADGFIVPQVSASRYRAECFTTFHSDASVVAGGLRFLTPWRGLLNLSRKHRCKIAIRCNPATVRWLPRVARNALMTCRAFGGLFACQELKSSTVAKLNWGTRKSKGSRIFDGKRNRRLTSTAAKVTRK